MIIVSGTHRSGTSLWMQILIAAGFEHIGEAFPRNADGVLRQANPLGFFESRLAAGVNFQTNPDPESGEYLFPDQTEAHAVKIFLTGLVRTDVAFIDRAIVTVRPWREFVSSLARLHRITGQEEIADEIALHPVLTWWTQNFAAIRDIATRRYPVHVLSYPSLVQDPKQVVTEVLGWIGKPDVDVEAAIKVVDPKMQTQRAVEEPELPEGVGPEHVAVFDEFYRRIHEGDALDGAFVERLNATDLALRPLIVQFHAAMHGAMAKELSRESGQP